MTTIDEIMVAAYAYSEATASGGSVCPRLAAAELRSIIGYALDKARADGAREMREAAAQVTVCDWPERADAADKCATIRAMPLPAGTVNVVMDREHGGLTFAPAKREPVRLKDGEAMDALPDCHGASLGKTWLLSAARAIETAVLAANGLTK